MRKQDYSKPIQQPDLGPIEEEPAMTKPASEDLCREAARHRMVDEVCNRYGSKNPKLLAQIITRGLILIGVADFTAKTISAVVASVLDELCQTFDLPPWAD